MKNVRRLLDKHAAARIAVHDAIARGRFLQGLQESPSDPAPGVRLVRPHEGLSGLLTVATQNALSALRYRSSNAVMDAVARDHSLSYTELFWELTTEAEDCFNPKIDRLLEGCQSRWKPGLTDALFTMASIESDALIGRAVGGTESQQVRAMVESASRGFLVCGILGPDHMLVVAWEQVRQAMSAET